MNSNWKAMEIQGPHMYQCQTIVCLTIYKSLWIEKLLSLYNNWSDEIHTINNKSRFLTWKFYSQFKKIHVTKPIFTISKVPFLVSIIKIYILIDSGLISSHVCHRIQVHEVINLLFAVAPHQWLRSSNPQACRR